MNAPEWYPNLTGKTDPQVERAVRIAFDSIYELRRRLNGSQPSYPVSTSKSVAAAAQSVNQYITNMTNPSSGLTLQQIRSALQAQGGTPLNVQSLLGVLAQPQIGGAPTVTALPSPPSPTAQDGALVSLAGVLYRFNGTTSPGVWEALLANGVIAYGTRGAKPGSGTNGTLYFETDTGWLYYGTGAGWAFIAGIDYGTDATRSGIAVAAADNGAMFLTSDTFTLWRVVGGAWTSVPVSNNVLATANATAQTVNIAATTLFTPAVTAVYGISVYVLCSNSNAGTVDTTLTWTDASGAQSINPVGTLDLGTTGNFVSYRQEIHAVSGNAVQYSTTVAGVVAPAAYDIHLAATFA